MSRILRYGVLGLLCALPLAAPQLSEAASPVSARAEPARLGHTSRAGHSAYRGHGVHGRFGHRHIHLRHCR